MLPLIFDLTLNQKFMSSDLMYIVVDVTIVAFSQYNIPTFSQGGVLAIWCERLLNVANLSQGGVIVTWYDRPHMLHIAKA